MSRFQFEICFSILCLNFFLNTKFFSAWLNNNSCSAWIISKMFLYWIIFKMFLNWIVFRMFLIWKISKCFHGEPFHTNSPAKNMATVYFPSEEILLAFLSLQCSNHGDRSFPRLVFSPHGLFPARSFPRRFFSRRLG